jgi:hypothetical protein
MIEPTLANSSPMMPMCRLRFGSCSLAPIAELVAMLITSEIGPF